ncbi:MAG TPA: hypothetical protein H9727_01515 [Candidatus Borkfalkia avistercoris]|uniref:CBM-cenC domain-containing protein n=1 Tax=Candidatus Borkfalkia avistercoris TaxID=2838504 RepID=A0A9D2CX45_9FIRM|nr:hypothetical protein [Candidatus Borkfalkia avistercoris]
MKKFFGILGSVILCMAVACCFVGCGGDDETTKMEVVTEWNMGVTEGFTLNGWQATNADKMEYVDNAEAKDGKALQVTVSVGGGVNFRPEENHARHATKMTMRIYSETEAGISIQAKELNGDWACLIGENPNPEVVDFDYDYDFDLKTGWNEYEFTFNKTLTNPFNLFVFKGKTSGATFLIDTITFMKPAETK